MRRSMLAVSFLLLSACGTTQDDAQQQAEKAVASTPSTIALTCDRAITGVRLNVKAPSDAVPVMTENTVGGAHYDALEGKWYLAIFSADMQSNSTPPLNDKVIVTLRGIEVVEVVDACDGDAREIPVEEIRLAIR